MDLSCVIDKTKNQVYSIIVGSNSETQSFQYGRSGKSDRPMAKYSRYVLVVCSLLLIIC